MLNHIPRQGGVSRSGLLCTMLSVLAMFLCSSLPAHAVAPPAGSSITNQASASYKDGSGQVQRTTSNPVVTTVSQVGAYTLAQATASKNGAAGSTVNMPYVLTNTGNGADNFTISVNESATTPDFSKIEVYLDDGEGKPASSVPLCTSATAGTACAVSAFKLESGVSMKFVVAYTIPVSATTGNWGSNTATVTAAPVNAGALFSTYTNASEQRTDTITLTTGILFDVSLSIKAPQVSPVSGTWPVATSGPRATNTTFTVSYANKGAQTGNLYLTNTLPSGLTYQAGKSVISCASGTALSEAAGGDTSVCSSQPNIEFEYDSVSKTLKLVIPSVQANSMGTLSFQVQVSNTAAVGIADTTDKVQYAATGCSASTIALCSAATLSDSNTAEFTVTATRGVNLNTADTTAGTPASSADGFTNTAIVAGSYVLQDHTVTNTGNDSDTFNLSVAIGNFPAGTLFNWFHSDGATPLLDTNSDGTVDTGIIAAGANKALKLQILVPSTTAVNATANLQATATATSASSSAAKDATYAGVTRVMGGYFDMTSTASGGAVVGDIGAGPGTLPVVTTTAIEAGSAVVEIALYLKNNDSANNTFNLAASSQNAFPGSLPSGWTVVFSDTRCTSPTAITSKAVTGGQQVVIYACVSTPPTSPTVVQPLYFKGTSTNNTTAGSLTSDVIYYNVSIAAASQFSMSLQAPGLNNTTKGSSADYAHVLTNTGVASCGAGNSGTNYLKVTATLESAKAQSGWTVAIYKDVDNSSSITAGDTQITDGKLQTGGLAAGANVKFVVRVISPSSAQIGETATATVTVSDVDSTGNTVQETPAGCGSLSLLDTTTVVVGALTVVKQQVKSTGTCASSYPSTGWTTANLTAAPGDCIYYDVTATNNGVSALSNVSLADAAANYTNLMSTPAVSCSSTGMTGSTTAASSGVTVSCAQGGTNTMSPGGSLTMRYAVQVRN